MNLLTDDEINTMADEYLENYRIAAGCALNFGRDVEQAVLSKLTAGVSMEPVHHIMSDGVSIGYYSLDQLTTAIAAARCQALEEAAKECDRTASDYKGMFAEDESLYIAATDCAKEIRALIGANHGL